MMRWYSKVGLAAALLVGVQTAANAQWYIEPSYNMSGYGAANNPIVIGEARIHQSLSDVNNPIVLFNGPGGLGTGSNVMLSGDRVLTHSAVVSPTVLDGTVIHLEADKDKWNLRHPNDVSPFGLFHPNNWFGRIFGYME